MSIENELKTVSPAKLSEITGIPLRTLASWRRAGKGPIFIKADGKKGAVRYLIKEVEKWVLTHLNHPR